jgi:hypothetical protein
VSEDSEKYEEGVQTAKVVVNVDRGELETEINSDDENQ